MRRLQLSIVLAAVLSASFASCSADLLPDFLTSSVSEPAPRKPAADRRPRTETKAANDGARPVDEPRAREPVIAGPGLLERLPASTVLAVRVASAKDLREAWTRTFLPRLWEEACRTLEREGQRDPAAELEQALDSMPGSRALLEIVRDLEGEIVIGVALGDLASVITRRGSPLDFTAMVDAGERAEQLRDRIDELLVPLAAEAKLERATDEWAWSWASGGVAGRMSASGSTIEVQFGAPDRTAKPRAKEGFLASDLMRARAQTQRELGIAPCLEVYVHAAAVWPLARAFAPADAQAPLEKSGTYGIDGISYLVGLEGGGITGRLTWHSEQRGDLFSTLIASAEFDRAFARFVLEDATCASLSTFDLATTWMRVRELLPPEAVAQLDQAIAAARTASGVDLERELLNNVGPTVAFSIASGYEAVFAGMDPGITIAIQVRDESKADWLLQRVREIGQGQGRTRDELYRKRSITAFVPGSLPAGNRPAWCLIDDAILLSSDLATLQRVIDRLEDPRQVVHAGLDEALAKAGNQAFSVAWIAGGERTLPTIAIGRRSGFGWHVEEREGSAAFLTSGFVGGTAIASAVAIPHLMQARLAANEKAVVARLRALWSAEHMAVEARAIDRDGDGSFEFATLRELCGAGGRDGKLANIDPPMLAAPSEWNEELGTSAGYHMRLDLVRIGDGSVCPDHAEQRFCAMAWPKTLGSTGVRCYAIDESGTLYVTDNQGGGQRYSGLDRAPGQQAFWLEHGDDPEREVWKGVDGGIWRYLE